MRVWILALVVLLWTSCDSVRYGSVPCEGEDCEASLDNGDDSKISSANGSSANEKERSSSGVSSGKSSGKSSSNLSSSSSHRWSRRSSSSVKDSVEQPNPRDTVEHRPINDTAIVGDYACRNGELVPVEALVADGTEETGDFRRSSVAISGFAEKGPFRYGTSIKIVELDSLKRLADSKRTHETCILNSSGSFNFANVNLVSPYVRVEANGYYMDELTGALSSSLVKLNAVVDLSKRDSFNVNMLTHMAAPRVMKLVEDSGNNQPIGSQSGRALNDVLSSFGISLGGSGGNGNFGGWNRGGQTAASTGKSAEDISLFGSDDYSAALLAVSVMMQSYGSANDMLRFADFIADDIRGDGNWGDNASKAKLADKLMILDAEGGLEQIRKNMEGWNIGNVPDFEKHVRNFWTKTHGFETCGSMNAGQVKHVGNSQSAYFVSYYEQPDGPKIRFICDRTTKNWRVATDLEKDTYGLGAGDYDGQIKSGKVNQDKSYIYDQGKKSWRVPEPGEILEFEDVADVMKTVAAGEKVIFILRHAERTDDTGKTGHLTSNGKKQSQTVGEKFKGEDISFANSTYTRSYETCENVATGAGYTQLVSDTIADLDGAWFVKNDSKLEDYKNSDGGGWVVTSAYAYKGSYSDAFYPLKSRGEEFITEVVKPRFEMVSKIAVWISHDMLVVPLAVFCTDGKVNLRYFDTKQWINYLAGVAVIMGVDGTLRYVPVKGLTSGTMTL
jgi:broad specificity phosphatase PhoE